MLPLTELPLMEDACRIVWTPTNRSRGTVTGRDLLWIVAVVTAAGQERFGQLPLPGHLCAAHRSEQCWSCSCG